MSALADAAPAPSTQAATADRAAALDRARIGEELDAQGYAVIERLLSARFRALAALR